MREIKKVLAGILAVVMAVTSVGTQALADEKTEEEKKLQKQLNKIKAMTVESNQLPNWPKGPEIYAKSGIVMDMDTGAILYAKNINAKQYPASITKLMTVLVALEHANLTDKITFSKASIDFLEYGDAQIGMKVGEELTLEQALHAILLASANEVSYAVAESVGKKMGGDYQTFIDAMNAKAKELGCTGTHFVNPNGLHDDNHYVTAHDMALIGRAVYAEDEFRTIEKTYEYKIGKTNKSKKPRVFQQNHKMTWEGNSYYYKYCTGGKTGFTDQAHTTLVTFAEKGGKRLVDVNLCSYGVNVYKDTKKMLNYSFKNFSHVPVPDTNLPEGVSSIADNASVTLPSTVTFDKLVANVEKKEETTESAAASESTSSSTAASESPGSTEADSPENAAAVIHYTYETEPVGDVQATLIVATPSPKATKAAVKGKNQKNSILGTSLLKKQSGKKERQLEYGFIGLWGVLVLLFVVVCIRKIKKSRRRRKQKARKEK